MLKHLGLLLALLVVSAAPSLAQSTPAPATITFQGRIAKPDGTPVPDTTSSLPYVLRISLWDAPIGGTKKWETIATVSTKNGVFSTPLEFGANAETALGGNRWIEMKIGNDLPLLPRQQLFPVAYALSANSVPNAAITSAKLADAAVLNAKLADFAITASKIQDLAIITAKLVDLAVTAAKLADNAVTRQKIANDAVDNTKLASDSASLSKVSGGGLTITGGNLVVSGGLQVGANVDVQGSVRINGVGSGVRFPDGSFQTTASSAITAGYSIIGTTPIPPSGFAYSGQTIMAGEQSKFRTPLPESFQNSDNIQMCASGGKLYVHARSQTDQSLFFMYDVATDTWTTKSPPTHIHVGGTLVDVAGHPFLLGGTTNNGVISTLMEEYSPDTNQWTVRTTLPHPRGGIAVCVLDNKMYVFGGTTENEVFNLSNNQWSTKAPLPFAISIGTESVTGVQNTIYIPNYSLSYDTISDTWGRIAYAYGTFGMFSYAINNKLYSWYDGVIEAYDPVANEWAIQSISTILRGAGIARAYYNFRFYMLGRAYLLEFTPPTKYYIHTKQFTKR